MKGISRPTIRSVAERAGVSRATISKVLRNQYGVSAALRARVEEAVRELNYRPLASARALRGRGHAIGILMAEISNPFFPQIIDSMAQALDNTDYQTFLGIGHFQEVRQHVVEMMIDRQMDRLIMIAPSMSVDTLQKFVNEIPVVVVGYSRPDAMGFDTINNEDHAGARLVIRRFTNSDTETSRCYPAMDRIERRTWPRFALLAIPRPCVTWGSRPDPYLRSGTLFADGAGCRSGTPRRKVSPSGFAVSDGYAVHLYNAADELGIAMPATLRSPATTILGSVRWRRCR